MNRLTFDDALMTLQGSGPVMEIAREVSRILRDAGVRGGIIGGVAVVLHGHVRTIVDVDVFVADDPELLAEALRRHGFKFDAAAKQFLKNGVPIHLFTISQIQIAPRQYEQISDVMTVSLADLINMKLRSGTHDMLRAQDLADVIGLMRRHELSSEYTPHIESALRPEFRKLADALRHERGKA